MANASDGSSLRDDYAARIARVPEGARHGKVLEPGRLTESLEAILVPGDRVVIEGCNQKQARHLAKALASLDQQRVHDLHMAMPSVVLDEHLDVFRRGIARRLDFAFSGPQAKPLAELVAAGTLEVGAIHTYAELYGRYCTDLTPRVALVAAEAADRDGNLYTAGNTEDTALLCDVTHGRKGIVVAEVREIVDRVPRIDVPGDQVEFVVPTGEPTYVEPLFTRDPARITPQQVLMAMMVIKGIYAEYGVRRLNHGIGHATAAVELLLPTYAAGLGLEGSICTHWVLNPHPTLIPAIESGFVRSVYSFGSEPGMEDYIAARQDVFFTCHDGVLRSNRPRAHMAGHYATDCFVGSTLQIDGDGNSSTATLGRIAGFGGAPNLGCSPPGRRHASLPWDRVGHEADGGREGIRQGRKLVVQVVPTRVAKRDIPVFVKTLDAVAMADEGLFASPPVMIYGDDVTHIVTEVGIAYLCRCAGNEERRHAIAAVAGDTLVGATAHAGETARLRGGGAVAFPEDLGIDASEADVGMLAASSITDLARISGGRYRPPARFAAPPAGS